MMTQRHRTLTALALLAFLLVPVDSLRLGGNAQAFHFPWDQGHDTFSPDDPDEPDNPPEPPCDPCNSTGSPVYVAGGNLVLTSTDVSFGTVGEPVALSRTYNSQDDRNGPFGRGWTLNYGIQAIPVTDGAEATVIIRMADGQRFRFVRDPSGVFLPPKGRHETLEEGGGGILILTLGDGLRYEFDNSTRPTAIIDRNGNRLSLRYDAFLGVLEAVVDDNSGRELSLTIGPNGKFASATDPLGNSILYDYDASGRLTGVTDPLGNTTTYQYDSSNRLTRITDPSGVVLLTAGYDGSDRITAFSERGVTYTLQYQTNRTIKRDSAGNATIYDLTAEGMIRKITNPVGGSVTRTFDADFNVVAETGANGFTSNFGYDSRGNLTTITEPGGIVTTMTYHPQLDFVTSVTDPTGMVTQLDYDANGNLLQVVGDAGGAQQTTTSYQYDVHGQRTAVTDGNGNTTTLVYDLRGNVVSQSDPEGGTVTRTYDDMGRVLTVTDPLGRVSTSEYDAAGRMIAAEGPLGGRTTFVWDASGNLESFTDAEGNTTAMVYNNRNLLIRTTDALGNVFQRTYNTRNNQLASVVDPDGATTTYTYDAANRLTRITDPLGRVLEYVLDGVGQATEIRAPGGRTARVTWNFRGDPVSVTNSAGGATTYAYDSRGLRTAATDANGNTTSFSYDRIGRLTSIEDPLGRTWTFAHDGLGNLTRRTDPLGQTIQLSYDRASRPVSTSFPDATSVTRTYDAVGNLLRLVDPFTDLEMTYDARNRLSQLTDHRLGKSVVYGYDLLDRRVHMVSPEGAATDYTYNANGQLTVITHGTEVTTRTYRADGKLATEVLPNGTRKEMSYDVGDQLLSLVHRASDGSVLQSFAYTYDTSSNITRVVRENGDQITYGYDAADRVVAEQRTGNVSYSHQYAYDLAGNRTSFGSDCASGTCSEETTYSYDVADQLLQEVSPAAVIDYAYDANGNLMSRSDGITVLDFAYDFENRLIAFDAPGTANDSIYEYDADGKRTATTVGGTTRRFFYERADEFYTRDPLSRSLALLNRWLTGTNVLSEYDTAGDFVAGYVNGLGLDERISRSDVAGGVQYYLGDSISSVTGTVDAGESLVNVYDYSAYGVAEQVVESQDNPYGFISRPLDEESGLYYLRARYYDPNTGRFLSRDPLVEVLERTQLVNEEQSPLFRQIQKPHAYGYAGDSPTKVSDPTGTSLIIVCSLGLPVCSLAIFCSGNVGACSAGIVCSGTIGACSAGLVCSGTAAGACSAGVACSGSLETASACSAAVVCSGQLGWYGAAACSASVKVCSGQVGGAGVAACSLSTGGACSGQAGAIGAGVCSAQITGVCSAQVGGQGSGCSAQLAGACSAQYGFGGYSGCSAQLGGACSAQGGAPVPGPGGNYCSAMVSGSCSARTGAGACSAVSQADCSARTDANGNCCPPAVSEIYEGEEVMIARAPTPQLDWRQVLSSLDAGRRGDAGELAWTVTRTARGGGYTVLRWTDRDGAWQAVDRGRLAPGRVHRTLDRGLGAAAGSYLLRLDLGGQTLEVGPFDVAGGQRIAGVDREEGGLWQWLTGAVRGTLSSVLTFLGLAAG